MNLITDARWWWLDLVILAVLIFVHVASWIELTPSQPEDSAAVNTALAGLRSAVGAGLTVAGIVAPLSLIAITVGVGDEQSALVVMIADLVLTASYWSPSGRRPGAASFALPRQRSSTRPIR